MVLCKYYLLGGKNEREVKSKYFNVLGGRLLIVEQEVVEQDEIECLSPKNVMGLLKLSKGEVYQLFSSKDFPCFLV